MEAEKFRGSYGNSGLRNESRDAGGFGRPSGSGKAGRPGNSGIEGRFGNSGIGNPGFVGTCVS